MRVGVNNVGRAAIRYVPYTNFTSFYRQWDVFSLMKLKSLINTPQAGVLNLRVSSARWDQQRAKKCSQRVFCLTRKQEADQHRLLSCEPASLGSRCSVAQNCPGKMSLDDSAR